MTFNGKVAQEFHLVFSNDKKENAFVRMRVSKARDEAVEFEVILKGIPDSD